MYCNAHQRVPEFRPICVSDSKLFIYLPSSYHGIQSEISMRVLSQEDPLEAIEMNYKVKQVQEMVVEQQSTQLLSQSIEDLMSEITVDRLLCE